MSTLQAVGIIISEALVGFAAVWWICRLLKQKDARIVELIAFRDRDTADHAETWSLYTAELEDLTIQLRMNTQELQIATTECADWKRRAEEYRKRNESVLEERDKWMHLYDRQAIGHGNAQVWMLETIEGLAGQLRAHGIKVAVPPVVRQAHELFLEEHVNPVLERTGTPTVHRGNQVTSEEAKPEGQG